VAELSGSGRIRASDAERERVARLLATAFTEARLDLVEYDNRVAAAHAAVYRDELTALLHDLPTPDRSVFDIKPATRRRAAGWPVVIAMLGAAVCLARLGWFGPLTAPLLLVGLAIALGWASGDSGRRR
jgi:hypothetical protein